MFKHIVVSGSLAFDRITDFPGKFVFHCHILNHAENDTGLFGMVTALIVNDPAKKG